ncbi:TauD/TfdA family dioxygenase [Edaphobacter dinghuensis]|uniref:TauD/TfdA family dioxygenase n=1 Tax=Edaphobacter dinghuensis TaxID=1560005 RepID=UPI001667FD77|nr:TauD/TfdA family dioxygenase [Edaphobacter dinghuensis]
MIQWHVTTSTLPLEAHAERPGSSVGELRDWLLSNPSELDSRLMSSGAVLFRNFAVTTPEEFQEIAAVVCGKFADYVGGNSPRTRVASHVFTSTEYPRTAVISMHNEASYLPHMPRRILFYCAKPAATGGQTPLADCRRILTRISPAVTERFVKHGVIYVNNLHGGRGFGRSWIDVFDTRDKHEVQKRLKADGYDYEWTKNGGLRTMMRAPSVIVHPETGARVWINQAEQWHPSSLDPAIREQLLSILPVDELPHYAVLGNGSEIEEQDLEDIRRAMLAEERIFQWRSGDILLCDNFLVMHGRQAYTGDRRVLVSMG